MRKPTAWLSGLGLEGLYDGVARKGQAQRASPYLRTKLINN